MHFMDAVIQMFTRFQELKRYTQPPDIGKSKKACFLSFHFFQMHRRYGISGSHFERSILTIFNDLYQTRRIAQSACSHSSYESHGCRGQSRFES